jgi:hypothetical protein
MPETAARPDGLCVRTAAFYGQVLDWMDAAQIPFLIGGAYELQRLAGIVRHTKDLDLFVLPEDCSRTLRLFADNGFRTDLTFPHWLGKIFSAEDGMIDVIFSSGNGIARVDQAWFTHALPDQLLDRHVRLCPVEEMIWSKAFIMERERFDGADIAHFLRARAGRLDWPRLLNRFRDHEAVLLSHLILFCYSYPSEQSSIPSQVLQSLWERLPSAETEAVCQGTMLSRTQYLVDLGYWGYQDARLAPRGPMTAEDIAHWTAAIEEKDRPAYCPV